MNDIEMRDILNQLPDWSRSVDPTYQPNYEPLKEAALRFFEIMPVVTETFVLDVTALAELTDLVPPHVVSALEDVAGDTAHSRNDIIGLLGSSIGQDQSDRYQQMILRHCMLWRRELVTHLNTKPRMPQNLSRASSLYLFARVIFRLPLSIPLDIVKSFGGWFHPSMTDKGSHYDLSWPVEEVRDYPVTRLQVHPFLGYFGQGYDAAAEYDYFADNFCFRDVLTLRTATIMPVSTHE